MGVLREAGDFDWRRVPAFLYPEAIGLLAVMKDICCGLFASGEMKAEAKK